MIVEVCVDSVESAVNAEKGGAHRLELCSSLIEGGTTPSVGMLKVIKQLIKIPVFVMVRPRGGDFFYTDHELDVMKEDIASLKESGADGVVLGVLTSAGTVDMPRCQELIDEARPLPVTFHRAIDMTCDIYAALEHVICLGCERVLTSGGENTALEGAPVIRRLTEQAGERIIVVPGAGITERNALRILDETGSREIHASLRHTKESSMMYQNTSVNMGASYGPSEYSLKVTATDRVKGLVQITKGAL